MLIFLLGRNYLNEEVNCHGNFSHTLILILIVCNFGIQAHGMESIPSEIISLARSSQLTYHIYCYLSLIKKHRGEKDGASVHLCAWEDKHIYLTVGHDEQSPLKDW